MEITEIAKVLAGAGVERNALGEVSLNSSLFNDIADGKESGVVVMEAIKTAIAKDINILHFRDGYNVFLKKEDFEKINGKRIGSEIEFSKYTTTVVERKLLDGIIYRYYRCIDVPSPIYFSVKDDYCPF